MSLLTSTHSCSSLARSNTDAGSDSSWLFVSFRTVSFCSFDRSVRFRRKLLRRSKSVNSRRSETGAGTTRKFCRSMDSRLSDLGRQVGWVRITSADGDSDLTTSDSHRQAGISRKALDSGSSTVASALSSQMVCGNSSTLVCSKLMYRNLSISAMESGGSTDTHCPRPLDAVYRST